MLNYFVFIWNNDVVQIQNLYLDTIIKQIQKEVEIFMRISSTFHQLITFCDGDIQNVSLDSKHFAGYLSGAEVRPAGQSEETGRSRGRWQPNDLAEVSGEEGRGWLLHHRRMLLLLARRYVQFLCSPKTAATSTCHTVFDRITDHRGWLQWLGSSAQWLTMTYVGACGCLWVPVGVCGCLWVSVGVCGCMWVYVGVCIWVHVGACGCLWVSVGVCGCLWVSVGVCGCMSLGACGCLWVYVGVCGCMWVSVGRGCLWVSVGVCGCLWVYVGVCLWVHVGVCGCMWVYVGVCGCLWVSVGVCSSE